MPTAFAPAAAQPEPTLREILSAVNGLGTRIDGLESRFDGLENRMVSVENEVKGLTLYVGEQFAHTTREIAKLRAADEEHLARFERIDAKLDEQRLVNEEHRARFDRIDVKLDEVIRLGEDNRRIGLKNQEDIVRIDRQLDAHIADREIHLPRPRSVDIPDIGPMAA